MAASQQQVALARPPAPKKKTFLHHLVAGGLAGFMESSCAHPLDTIKTRMQLRAANGSKHGMVMTGFRIVQKESFFALYKVSRRVFCFRGLPLRLHLLPEQKDRVIT